MAITSGFSQADLIKLGPDEVERKRKIAEALLASSASTAPIGHWTQGAARLAQALSGKFQQARLDKAEQAGMGDAAAAANAVNWGSVFGGSPTLPGATSSTSSSTQPAGNSSYRDAIASIESAGSGDYSAVGPTHPKMGPALGRYQIMEANLAPWGQEALGRPVSKEEFLSNPKIQDAIFDAKFGSYVSKYGPEGAAQAWFAGPGGVGKTDRKDVLGTDVGSYGKKFLSALDGSQAPVQVASLDPSAGMGQAAPVAVPQPPQQGPVGVGGVPAGSGGQPVLDVTQMPQLSSAAGLPFQGAPQQQAMAQPANPIAQALIKGGQGQLSPQGMAAHDKALGGILAGNSGQAAPQAQKIAQTLLGRGQGQNYFPPAPDPNRPDFAPQSMPEPAPQNNVQQLMAVINHPYATREQKMMAANALQQIQQRNDPANQLDMEYKRAQLDALRAKPTTKYGFVTLPDGTVLRTNETSGAADPIYQGGDKPTSDIQNYEYYVRKETEAGRQPLGPLEYEQTIKKAGATNINNNNGTTTPDGDFRKKLDENEGKQWSDYKTTGTVSAGMNQDFQVLGELMKVAPQGAITGRLAEAFPGISSAGDAFQSIVKRIAPTLRAPGSGSTSDIEYDGMLRSLPALRNKPEANQMILSIMQAKQQLNMKRAGIINDYQTNKLNIDQAREAMQQLDSQSILTPEIKASLDAIGPQPSKGDATPAPEGVNQGVWDHMTPEERKLWLK